MVDDDEWDWIVEHSSGAFDHVIIASTLPVFLPIGIHHLQAWNEALCARPLGTARGQPERAAPARSRPRALGCLQSLLRAAVRLAADDRARNRRRGAARVDPAARRRRALQLDQRGRSRRRAIVRACTSSSARRSAIPSRGRSGASCKQPGRASQRSCSDHSPRLAGVTPPSASWTPIRDATFENALGELVLEGRSASATIRRSPREGEDPELLVAEQPLTLADASHDQRRPAAGSAVV